MAKKQKLGATGEFPEGKIDPSDKGAIKYRVGADQKTQFVIMEFGTPVTWLGLKKNDAIALANSLVIHALTLKD